MSNVEPGGAFNASVIRLGCHEMKDVIVTRGMPSKESSPVGLRDARASTQQRGDRVHPARASLSDGALVDDEHTLSRRARRDVQRCSPPSEAITTTSGSCSAT